MKKVHTLLALLFVAVLIIGFPSTGPARQQSIIADAEGLIGAGATFPAPLYLRWIQEFARKPDGFSVFYDAVGSGDGIRRFMDQTVDFGASDAAMNDEQISTVGRGVKLIPATAGIIGLAYNLPGVDALRLSRAVYVDIFLGQIQSWDDPADSNPKSGCTAAPLDHRDDYAQRCFRYHLGLYQPPQYDQRTLAVKRARGWQKGRLAGQFHVQPLQ